MMIVFIIDTTLYDRKTFKCFTNNIHYTTNKYVFMINITTIFCSSCLL